MPGIVPGIVLVVLVSAAMGTHAAGLPDTGQTICYSDSAADPALLTALESIARDGGTHPRQDCRYWRDAATIAGAITKTGAGPAGFDYTKIANDGTALPASATLGNAAGDWACTRDNVTGLTWEVKTVNGSLSDTNWVFTWFDDDFATNGGNEGSTGSNSCGGNLGGNCNTKAYISAINFAQLCTYADWRLPTQREALTTVNVQASGGALVAAYFPNMNVHLFWSGTSFVENPANAWGVDGGTGGSFFDTKVTTHRVRLVRGGPF